MSSSSSSSSSSPQLAWRSLSSCADCRIFRVSRLSCLLFVFIFYLAFTLGSYVYCSYTLYHISTLCPQLFAAFVALIVTLLASYTAGIACFCHVYTKRRKAWKRWKTQQADEERLDEQEMVRTERDTAGEEDVRPGHGDADSAEDDVQGEREEAGQGEDEDAEQPGAGERKASYDAAAGLAYSQPSELHSSLLEPDHDDDQLSSPKRLYPDLSPSPNLSQLFSSVTCKRALLYSLWLLLFALLLLLFLVCMAAFILVVALQVRTLPKLSGVLRLPGLQRPVTVSRDDDGLIHVQGFRRSDVFFAQGVVMAQERMWQMEMQRKLAQGRLSELVGANDAALEVDRLSRVLGYERTAEASLSVLSIDARLGLEAFVQGINAYLDTEPPLGVEFFILGLDKPQHWRVVDVLLWAKVMSWLLSGNLDREMQRWDWLQRNITMQRIERLLPPYDLHRFPTIMPDGHVEEGTKEAEDERVTTEEPIEAWLRARPHVTPHSLSPSTSALRDVLQRYRSLFGPTHASNSWAVSGSLTESGSPLLCNDPHLPLSAPSLWILFHLQVINDAAPVWRREDVIGASLAGVPGILIGRNNVSSWALTNTGADVQDLYVMEDSADGTQYRHNGSMHNYTFVTDTIRRKGASDVSFTYRTSRYGPVLSDLTSYASPYPLSLRWTSLLSNDTTVNAFLEVNLATNFPSFRRALKSLVAPSQSFLYADQHTIAYQMTGLIPTRVSGHTGKYPAPGDGSADWVGWLAYEALPSVVNPKQGWLVTANNRVTQARAAPVVSEDWDVASDGYRAQRIQSLIQSAGEHGGGGGPQQQRAASLNHSTASMRAMQADTVSLFFADMQPLFGSLQPSTEAGKGWARRLHSWGGDMAVGSQEATVFQLFYRQLCTLPYPELNETYCNPVFLYNVLIRGDKEPNCDGTPHPPPVQPTSAAPELFPASTRLDDPHPKPPATSPGCLAWASARLDTVVADSQTAPAWGSDVKPTSFAHQILSGSPLTCLSDRRVAHGGDSFTINVGPWKVSAGGGGGGGVAALTTATVLSGQQTAGSSYRQIIDLHSLERSEWEQSLGQSGNLISPWYDDWLALWQDVRLQPMRTLGFQRTYVLWLTSDSAQPSDPNAHLNP